jgi:D-xylose transport system permease protein
MVMVIVAGHIDLSVGSLVGLTGMIAVLVQRTSPAPLATSIAAALAAGALAGAVQGWLAAYVRVPSFIVTLGGLLAWRGLTKGLSAGNTHPVGLYSFKTLGQAYLSRPVSVILVATAVAVMAWVVLRGSRARRRYGLQPWSHGAIAFRIAGPSAAIALSFAVLNAYQGVPVPVLLFVVIAVGGRFVMQRTIYGRYLYAIGGNPDAARLSGIDSRKNVLISFVVIGALAAVAGIIYTARVGSASPDAGLLLELDAIAACVIGGASLMGGRGTVLGACLGALFMASLDNGMSLENVPDFLQDIVKGGILVVAAAFDVIGRRRA